MNIFQAWIGYTRTFAVDLNPDAQIHALTAAECGIVYRAQCSGTTQEGRPELITHLQCLGPRHMHYLFSHKPKYADLGHLGLEGQMRKFVLPISRQPDQ